MDLNALKSLVGEPFQLCDNEGNYVGCFAPLYFVWHDLPRYPLPERQSDYFHEAFSRLCENFDAVAFDERISAKVLDILVFRLAMGVLHVGIYVGDNQFLHVQRGSKVEITRLSRLSHRVVSILRRAVK